MISRNLYFQILFRILLIVLIALTAGSIIALNGSVLLVVLCLIIEVPVIVNLVNYLNKTNRKISFFLESIRNNDSSLSFPSDMKSAVINELYLGLSKVNKQIQQLKIENVQREQYFQTLLEQVPAGIVTFNSKGFVHHANSWAKKMLSVEILTHIDQLQRVDYNLYNTIQNIKPFEQKMVSLETGRGTIELSLKAASFKTSGETGDGRTETGEGKHDFTPQPSGLRSPASLLRTPASLLQSPFSGLQSPVSGLHPSPSAPQDLILLSIQDIRNELDVKELDSWMKLIRVLVHEIMNSIAPITSLSESLGKYLSGNGGTDLATELDKAKIKTIQDGLNVINDQGNSLMRFVESYKKLTRVPKPVKKSFRIEDLINRIKVLYSSLENSENVKLTISINTPEIELFADENLISHVLLNLLKNALESIEEDSEGRINISAGYNSNRRVEIKITDNGPGISNEIIDQIFVPFFTTRTNGSGIGLSLSRQIMRLHGGTLLVRSVPYKETTFSMIF